MERKQVSLAICHTPNHLLYEILEDIIVANLGSICECLSYSWLSSLIVLCHFKGQFTDIVAKVLEDNSAEMSTIFREYDSCFLIVFILYLV